MKDALDTYRNAAGSSDDVARTTWRLLSQEEQVALRKLIQDGEPEPNNQQARLAEVAQAVASFAEGSTDKASAARSVLARAGHKDKKKAERVLKFKFSRRVWAKVCAQNSARNAAAKKRGRKNKVKTQS